MRILKPVVHGVLVFLLAASSAFAQVQLTIRDGRVTLSAKDATVRQILTEWARIGQTKVVNVERIPGGPVTLQLTNVPEEEALGILLRSVSGYMAAPRPTAVGNLSRYDRILVMPTLAAPRQAGAAVAPVFQQPGVPTLAAPGSPGANNDEDRPMPSVVMPARGPLFQTFQQPQDLNPPQPGGPVLPPGFQGQPVPSAAPNGSPPAVAPAPSPGATVIGSPRPGMVIAPPVQPGQVQPGQPGPQGSPND